MSKQNKITSTNPVGTSKIEPLKTEIDVVHNCFECNQEFEFEADLRQHSKIHKK